MLYREKISEADMVLVGLGEEFDGRVFKKHPEYECGEERLKAMGQSAMIPAWREFCGGIPATEPADGTDDAEPEKIAEALEKLRALLEGKNYFVVSLSDNEAVSRTAWREGRLVTPCGTAGKKQCGKGCETVLEEVTGKERQKMQAEFGQLYAGQKRDAISCLFGRCPVCGSPMVLNNIYAENYNENGYLEQWQNYKKWLQGTVNKELLILELGVGMRFPTVIRWPFEKAAFFNRKAFFCRVNEKLYQITEELSGKGEGISQNAIEWLCRL